MSAVPFPEMGVFFVSREPVRDPAPIGAFAQVRTLLEKELPGKTIPGSISSVSKGGFVIAACPDGLGRAGETSLVEVYAYDPVRYQANIVGLVAPPRETPVHWIARRVNPDAAIACVVDPRVGLASNTEWKARPKGYWGNADTLLALGRMLKGHPATAIEGVGLVVVARTPAALVDAVGGAAGESKDATV